MEDNDIIDAPLTPIREIEIISEGDARDWWEARRLRYNMIILLFILIDAIYLYWRSPFLPNFFEGLFYATAFILLWLIITNVFYTVCWIFDILFSAIFNMHLTQWMRQVFHVTYTLLSVSPNLMILF